MVKLVTQYDLFRNGRDEIAGWDGASGPWLFHIIDNKNMASSTAPYVREGYKIDIEDWHGSHLTKFRLEIVYE